MKIFSFPPIFDDNSKILILGTMPSKDSLRLNQYYGNTRNSFWKIMFNLLNKEFSENYDVRKTLLLNNNIAVWDTLKACIRESSADADILSPEPNDITGFLEKYPNIKAVFCNGRDAHAYFEKYFPKLSIERYYLPSTSAANAISWDKKLNEWKRIEEYLNKH
ncbi:MAG: DNA-deoxyinosine glycosylase [Bacteroidetes bacterium]|nr:DNA-deoxyinosine glycosylase [Bacteroidota bacterium]